MTEYVDRLTALKEMCERPGEVLFEAEEITGLWVVRVTKDGEFQYLHCGDWYDANPSHWTNFRRLPKEVKPPSNHDIAVALYEDASPRSHTARVLDVVDRKIADAIADHERRKHGRGK